MANSRPVSSRLQMSSAPAPGPQPISRMWSDGCTSMKSTAQRIRAGIVCTAMSSTLPDRDHRWHAPNAVCQALPWSPWPR